MQIVVAKSEHDPRWTKRGLQNGRAANRSLAKSVDDKPVAKMSAADQAEVERLLANQSRLTNEFRRAFLAAIEKLGDRIDVNQLMTLLEQGRVGEAVSLIDSVLVSQAMQPVAASITSGTIWAGQQSALAFNALAPGELSVHFGITNPETVRFLHDYEMALIRALSQDALASVRAVIQTGVFEGRGPRQIAIDVRQFIGLTESQTKAVLNYRRMLETLDSGALQRGLRDARFDPTIRAAIDSGERLDPEYIDKLVERYRQRYLRYRSETIARTEAIRSLNAGNLQLWKQAVADGKMTADQVVRKWSYTHDARTRIAHRLIPDMNKGGVGLEEPFKTPDGPLMFPGDPKGPPQAVINCRCTVIMRYVPHKRPATPVAEPVAEAA